MQIIIINGANLNLLGKRETMIYGNQNFESYFEELKIKNNDIKLEYFQSNYEGAIINKIHKIGFSYNGIIINPGAFSHYSYAILDALKAVNSISIEVHISNIKKREDFRKKSITALASTEIIYGKGLAGYQLAIDKFKLLLK